MERKSFEAAALYEQRFWLQVMGDHARFIKGALAADEREEIQRAECFVIAFDQLLEQARRSLNSQDLLGLSQTAYQKGLEIRAFKLHLLERLLQHNIKFKLPTTFINHMVNEVEEFLRISIPLMAGECLPVYDAVHLHLMWLQDAIGHAFGVGSNLDLVENKLLMKSVKFIEQFKDFYLKAVEMAGYLRTNLAQFPALSRFNKEVEWEMLLFLDFLRELEELGLKNELLGTLMPLMADHMAREECYYLTKLAQVSEVKQPNCDPTKPRTEKETV